MKIGVISDSHDRLPTLASLLDRFRQANVSAVFHAGDFVAPFAAKLLAADQLDVPLHCIYGNNDGERAGLKKILPQLVDGPLLTTLDTPHGPRILAMAHFIDWFNPGDIDAADVVISGHNHQHQIEHRDNKLFINPGEACGWLTGQCTAAILDLSQVTPSAALIEVKG